MIAVMPNAHRAVRDQQLFGLCATLYRFSIKDVLYGAVMQKPPLDPDAADLAPTSIATRSQWRLSVGLRFCIETVENLGVVTPLNEMNAGSNRRLRHVGGQGAARPV
jgi:hypothetical protein